MYTCTYIFIYICAPEVICDTYTHSWELESCHRSWHSVKHTHTNTHTLIHSFSLFLAFSLSLFLSLSLFPFLSLYLSLFHFFGSSVSLSLSLSRLGLEGTSAVRGNGNLLVECAAASIYFGTKCTTRGNGSRGQKCHGLPPPYFGRACATRRLVQTQGVVGWMCVCACLCVCVCVCVCA